jgi:hypothetical protein
VGDQNRIDSGNVPAMPSEPFTSRVPADPGIEKKPDAARFDATTVAMAAGLEGNELHLLPEGRVFWP